MSVTKGESPGEVSCIYPHKQTSLELLTECMELFWLHALYTKIAYTAKIALTPDPFALSQLA